MATSGADLLVAAFNLLSAEEQDGAFAAISELRLRRLAGAEDEASRFLRSLRRVRQHLGQMPTTTSYRRAWRELGAAGEEVANLHALIRHFGSWRRAREALELSEQSTNAQIEARYAKRRLGKDKVWRYTEKTLSEVMARCVAALGEVPQVSDFAAWRERELALARARGDDTLHLPSASPYRRRWGTWEKALLQFGYTPDQVAERLERG